MSFIVLIFTVCGVIFARADELPWIGVSLSPAEEADRRAVDLSEGVSLKVMQVIPGGALQGAGGRVGDLWWKFDGQILINQRQMLVLLRTKSPGDRVKIEYFRDQKLDSLSLVLKSRDLQLVQFGGAQSSRSELNRTLAKREQIARVTIGERDLTLQKEGKGWRFEVNEGGTAVLSSLVRKNDLSEQVPPKWQGPFLILKLTLEQQATRSEKPTKRRARYISRSNSSEE